MTPWARSAGVALAALATACAGGGASSSPPVTVVRAEASDEPEAPAVIATGEASGESPTKRDAPLVGRWRGIGVQDDQQQWMMLVTIRSTSSGSCASVEYPDVPCSGTWSCVSLAADGELRAEEHIVAGQCVDGGTMTMRITSRDTLDWSWSGSGIHARATLERAP